jgi:dolichol-phosphate mannosyltransferase
MKLSIIVPVYNEEMNISPFVTRMKDVIKEIGCDYEILFSMDPSKDQTEKIILDMRKQDPKIKLLKMSRRFGQPACTIAGLHYCTGDACVVIDVDLQDPPELVKEMVVKWKEGYDVVYAQRTSRKGETFIKNIVSFFGYWLIDKVSEISIPRNTGDFRLLSRRVIEHLKKLKEREAFLRGLTAYVGFNQTAVKYHREPRLSGQGKYNRFLGSLYIGLNGLIGFSKYPLHLISIMGLIISLSSFFVGFGYLFLKLINYDIKWGNPTLIILFSFLSGVQLLSLGIMAEYFARIYDEIKGRPAFIVQDAHGLNEPNT